MLINKCSFVEWRQEECLPSNSDMYVGARFLPRGCGGRFRLRRPYELLISTRYLHVHREFLSPPRVGPSIRVRAVLSSHKKLVFRRQKRQIFDVKQFTSFHLNVGHSTHQGIFLLKV